MIICPCIKFESNTLYGPDRMDSGDIICRPIENGVGGCGDGDKKQEAHGPQVTHLSDITTADMQMLCNIFPILSSKLMKR